MARHELVKPQTAKQSKDNSAEKNFPGFLRADVRHHQMPPNHAARQIGTHVREFGDGDHIQHVELAGDLAAAGAWSEINNFGNEIEKPKDVEQTEQGVGHRLQRLVITQPREHLPSEYRKQKKKQDCDFEIVGACRADFGEVIKTAGEQHGAANHAGDFEVRQALVIEHPVKLPKANHSKTADQYPEQDLVTGEHDQQRDRP